VPDRYGDGGVVAELEDEIAGLLGKPAAVYLPSDTMARAVPPDRVRDIVTALTVS
jgi:threonine aldolase